MYFFANPITPVYSTCPPEGFEQTPAVVTFLTAGLVFVLFTDCLAHNSHSIMIQPVMQQKVTYCLFC